MSGPVKFLETNILIKIMRDTIDLTIFQIFNFSLLYCFIVLLFYCFIVLLFYCFIVLLFYFLA